MASVYAHTDYRKYLHEWYVEEKGRRPVVSFRWLGQKLATDPSLLAKIFVGERHLSGARIQPLVEILGLAGLEAEYFRILVQYGKAKSAKDAQHCFSKLAELRRVAPVPLEQSQAGFWDSWVHVALRALVGCGKYREEYDALGAMLVPRVPGSQVRKSLAVLAELGFLERDDDGFWRIREPFVRGPSTAQARALRHFHRQTLLLAAESVEALDPKWRDLSSVTVSIPESGYDEIRELVRDFRSRVLTAVSRMQNPDRVYQVSVQMVPFALPPETDIRPDGLTLPS
ncbi:MAG: TIGR02147 family protein [Fibrobacteres bacterium]|nr:TIGR02147 family protein [Fibrobacterota bacterium]